MKKNIIALAVAAAVAAPVANAAPTVYGKLNLNIGSDDTSGMSVGSTASRLGVKGSTELDGGLKAVYKMEFGVDGVADGSSTFSNRNQYLGLAGGFGTVLMGRHDTALKMSQPADTFNDGAADSFKARMHGLVTTGETRADDFIGYISPSFNGVKLLVSAEMTETTGKGTNAEANEETFDAQSIAVTYGSKKSGIYAAAATTTSEKSSVVRVSGQFKENGLLANLVVTQASGNNTTEGQVIIAQAAYKMGKIMPKVKFSSVDHKDKATKDGSGFAVGVNYSLGKKTTAYVYNVAGNEDFGVKDAKTFVGMVHSF